MTRRLTPAQALLFGTLTVGVLDLADALVFFGLRGVAPIRIPRSIAAGLLGRASFSGGLATAALGIALHFFIAGSIVATYYAVSRRVPALTRHPLLCGPAYGLLVYGIMNYVVIPLSAARGGTPTLPVLANGLLIHVLGVGLPAALFARAGTPPATEGTP